MAQALSYFSAISQAARSLATGMRLTLRHLLAARKKRKTLPVYHVDYFQQTEGIATVQYPYEMLPVPDNGRYRLHNEIDDCIVCDKCVKVCPVNCITIEPIKATEEIGKTSDGTPKRIYAAKFDIDMGKCCFCGLCTTVCPTECLTMTKVFDFSTFDIRDHNYAFAEMTDSEITEKKALWEQHQLKKQAQTPVPTTEAKPDEAGSPKAVRPVFRPKIKPKE
ncbi:MAG: 4Fe-4S binding protein [Bacteroidia bacterium]|nr:4Fe-4S binding protein [Bacteroidia bacterium]